MGPIDPVQGYPLWYEDRLGMRLQLCQTPGVCLLAIPNPTQPLSLPSNYPDEQFYYHVGTVSLGIAGALLSYEHALEAAFLNGAVAAGDQVVFSRFRLRITGLVNGATYAVTHPYGSVNYIAGVDGPLPGTINVTVDIGIGAAGQFGLALNGNVGPFLVPANYTPGAPGTFISDAVTEGPVRGSPFGTNFLRVAGPGIGGAFPANALSPDLAQWNNFSVQGQLAIASGVGINKAYISKHGTPGETAVEVWASATPGANLQLSTPGSTPFPMQEINSSGNFFGRVILPGGSPAPSSISVTNLSDNPPVAVTRANLTDVVVGQSAVFTSGGDLFVTAFSSDKVGNPVLSVSGVGITPRPLPSIGNGVSSGPLGLPLGAAPPESVTITSSLGGSATIPVIIEPTVPVTANAGPDQNVPPGATVTISGTASAGPIASYAWSQVSGPTVSLTGSDTPTVTFVAPSPFVAQQIVLQLLTTGTAGQRASDTVVVNVESLPGVVANAGLDRSVAGGAIVLLSAAASTGPIASYAWSSADPISITGANTLSASFRAPTVITGAVVTVTLTVTGVLGQTSTDTLVINVAPAAPAGVVVANAGADRSVAAGDSVQLSAAGSLGAITTYTWTHDAGTAIALLGASTASPSFTAPTSFTPSVITFTLVVSDGLGATATDTMVVNVAAIVPVFANAGVDQSVVSGARITLSGLASTGPISSYVWAQTSGPAVILTGATTASVSFTAPTVTANTVLTFNLNVRSAQGATSTDAIAIQVTPIQDVLTISQAQYIANNNNWRLQGTASQRLGQTITIYLGAVGDTARPIGSTVVPASGRWQLQTGRNSGPAPVLQTSVWASSSLGGSSTSLTFTRG